MWLLVMIVFNQPYQVDHIQLLGKYTSRQNCVVEQRRAVSVYNKNQKGPVSFGCMRLEGTTIKGANNEMGSS